MIEGWLAQAAEEFWERVRLEMPYPRDLSAIISCYFPLSVISLPQLSTAGVETWFQRQHIPFHFFCRNRSLCGCIVAVRGQGLIFLDSCDSESERRYTVVHEIAHFLLDYWQPRQEAARLFGENILPVLDGERPATRQERLDALLCGLPLGRYSDLMPRARDGGLDQNYILRAEQRADRLALELLAPAEQVVAVIPAADTLSARRQRAEQFLLSVYGLPLTVARKYSTVLIRSQVRGSSARLLGL